MESNFDVIVLGTSLDGLAAAALCAKQGLKTALFKHKDRNQKDFEAIAGAIQYRWDASIGVLAQLMNTLELKNRIQVAQPKYIDEIQLGDFKITREFGWLNYKSQLIDLFPSEKENLQIFFSEIYDIGQEWLLLLQTGSIFSVKKMMKYRDTLYSDFVEQHFTDPILINLLNTDIPRTKITLPVMAGFIATQAFDCHTTNHNYAELLSIFTQSIKDSNGTLFLDSEIINISKNEVDNNFIIKTKESDIISSKWIISTFDENNTYNTYFPEIATKRIDIKSYTPVKIITAKINSNTNQNNFIAKQFYSNSSPIETLTSLENDDSKELFKVKAFYNYGFIFIQGEFPTHFNDARNRELLIEIAKNKFNLPINSHEQIEWFSAEDIERYFGYSIGFTHRWAFRKNETAMNPFAHTTEIKNLQTTGHWGSAWFTAAITASRYVKQN